MKTKNIFRMLLVAAALLMGANNVKADDIWTTPKSNDADNGTTFNIPADNFNNLVRKGSKLRFYITVLNQYNWQLGFSINNSAISPDFSSFDGFKYGNYWGYQTVADKIIDEDNERYLEVICSETTASNLLDYGLDVTINHLSLSKVTLINEAVKYRTVTFNVDGSEYESKTIEVGDPIELPMPPTKTGYVYTGWANLPSVMPDEDITVEATFREGVEQTAWEDGTFSLSDDMYNSGLTIDNSFFNGVSGTIYVRIYGYNTIATGWRVKIGYFDGSSVQTPTFGNYNQGQIDSYSSESLNGSLLYGYIEFILDSTELGLLAQNGAKIGGSAFTATKVSVIASSATAAPKYTVSYTAEIYNEDQTKVGTVGIEDNVVEYEENATVTFYVTPEEGYEIDAVTVTGESISPITPTTGSTTNGTTTYTFSMPASDVTVSATFKAVQQQQEETYELVIGENIVWDEDEVEFGASWDATHISFTKEWFKDVDPDEYTNTVRIYGDFTNNSWVLQFKVDSENWPALSVWGSNNNANQANMSNVSVHTNNNSTYIEFTITQAILDEIKEVTNCIIQGINCTVSQVVINVAESSASGKQTMVLRFEKMTDTATVGDDYSIPTLYANNQAVDDPSELNITFTSEDRSIAKIDRNTGEIELVGPGETTITAYFPENDTYNEAYASFTLTVSAAQPNINGDWVTVSFQNGEDTYEYRTFVTPGIIDLSRSVGLKAYYATEASSTEVVFTENTDVCAAGVPLLLKKIGDVCKIWMYDEDADVTGEEPETNLLVAGPETVNSANDYVLTVHSGTVVFAETSSTNSANVDANHAYLHLNTAPASGRLRVKFSDESTGISNIEAETTNDGVIYNLRGQRVENPTKGLYIINGKKVVIK